MNPKLEMFTTYELVMEVIDRFQKIHMHPNISARMLRALRNEMQNELDKRMSAWELNKGEKR